MIETEAQVLRCEGGLAWVKIRPHSPCGNCDPVKGCKSVAITRLFGNAQESYQVKNEINAKEGELVKVAVNEGDLITVALWAYGLPLLLLIIGALVGAAIATPARAELLSLVGAVVGFFLGFLILRIKNDSAQSMQPRIIQVVSKQTQFKSCVR